MPNGSREEENVNSLHTDRLMADRQTDKLRWKAILSFQFRLAKITNKHNYSQSVADIYLYTYTLYFIALNSSRITGRYLTNTCTCVYNKKEFSDDTANETMAENKIECLDTIALARRMKDKGLDDATTQTLEGITLVWNHGNILYLHKGTHQTYMCWPIFKFPR